MRDEVVEPEDAFDDIPAVKSDHRMIDIAKRIIEQQEGPFEPEGFKDRYEHALRELIRKKEKGEKPVAAEPPEETNVIDLMEALKKSLQRKGAANTNRKAPPKRRAAR
jgi:DNA end-binding protein Ku